MAALRKKEQSFRSAVESVQLKLETESARSRDLDGQVREHEQDSDAHEPPNSLAETNATTIEHRNAERLGC